MIFSGAFVPVVVLASLLEVSKLVAVSWMYRYRHLAGRLLRIYFYAATIVLMSVTSMGIFGYLTRAYAEREGGFATAQLTLDEIGQRESALKTQRDMLTTELTALTTQSNQLVSQLAEVQRLTTTSGAVSVQRQTTARRQEILADITKINTQLSSIQKERIDATTETNTVTADIGPLRYVAEMVYGNEDVNTIRRAVVWLTVILMVVFDPMAIMLLIAANILFLRTATPTVSPSVVVPSVVPSPPTEKLASNSHGTDVPDHLLRKTE